MDWKHPDGANDRRKEKPAMNKLKKSLDRHISTERLSTCVYFAMLALLIVFSVFSYSVSYVNGGFNTKSYVTLSKAWVRVYPDGSEEEIPLLPADFNDKVGEEIVIRRRLPALFLVDSPVLFIRSNHQTVLVRIDGEEVYRYQFWAANRFDADFPPTQWLCLQMKDDWNGSVIELSLTRLQDDESVTVSEIYLGDRADIIFALASRSALPLLCALIAFVMGTFFLARQMFAPMRRELGYRNLHIGLVLLFLSMWVIYKSDVRQLFFGNLPFVRNMEFFTLMMLPVPIILSVNYSEKKRFNVAAHYLCVLILLADLAIMGLVLIDGYNLLSLLWLILLTLVVTAVFIVVSLAIIAGTDVELFRSLRSTVFSYGVLFLFGFLEYLDMFVLRDRFKGLFMSVGLLLYTFGLTFEQFGTQRRLIEQTRRAEMENRAKSDFLASMSHEIRTPINAVLGMDEMILREAKDATVLGYAADIQRAGRHLLNIINNILDFSRIESGHVEISNSAYDVAALLTDISDLIQVQADEKKLRFETRVQDMMPGKLIGDSFRIRQIAINLLNNAVKYTKRGYVDFSVDTISEEEAYLLSRDAAVSGPPTEITSPVYLRMVVRDSGNGIREEDMPRLFESFQRLDPVLNAGVQGTGLGLSIVSTLVQLMNGSLLVKSVYGVGTQFTLIIPQELPSGEKSGSFAVLRKENDEVQSAQGVFRAPETTVLAVDDNAINRRLLQALLRRTEVKLTVCESGKECLKLVGANAYDIILMDHLMPEMDGIETLHRMNELAENRCAGVPVIVLTANAVSGARESYLAEGFTDYLSKPIQSIELEEMLARYLPAEKVLPAEGAPPSAPDRAGALPEWLGQVDELSVADGLRFCATPETYLETLEIYAKNAASFADEIAASYREGDTGSVIVKVHALKSTSRAIGAVGLSTFAERLELSGKAGDTRPLDEELDGLLARYRALGAQLSERMGLERESEARTLRAISDEQLRETYDMIRALTEEFEYDRAASMIESLDGFDLPDAERERCGQLKRAAENFDWDRIGEILA